MTEAPPGQNWCSNIPLYGKCFSQSLSARQTDRQRCQGHEVDQAWSGHRCPNSSCKCFGDLSFFGSLRSRLALMEGYVPCCLFCLIQLQELLLRKVEFKNLPTDSSGQYKIEADFLQAKIHLGKDKHDVTLVTHCTSNHLHYLLDLTTHWKGPLSLGKDGDVCIQTTSCKRP